MRQRHPLPSGGFALVENAELEDNGCTGKVVGYSGCVGLSTNVGEVGDRLDLQVDLIARAECCPRCGRGPVMQGASGGRGPGLPIGGRATVLRWRKRRYRCASCARTFTETDPELPPRQRVTERFRRRLLGVSTLSISVFESEAGRPYAGLLQTLINTGVLGPYEQPRPVAELYLLYDFPAVAALVIHRRQYLVSPSSPADTASLALQTALEKTSQTAARLIINDAVWGRALGSNHDRPTSARRQRTPAHQLGHRALPLTLSEIIADHHATTPLAPSSLSPLTNAHRPGATN